MEIETIKSKDNKALKLMRLAKRGQDTILIEGPKLIDEALRGNFKLDTVAVTHESADRYRQVLERCSKKGARIISVSNQLLAGISEVVTSQGIVALSKPGFVELESLEIQKGSVIVICDGIQDPGNVGAIVRSAFAFNALAVIVLPATANAFGTKAIRGSAGACFRIPIIKSDPDHCISYLRDKDVEVFVLDAHGEILIDEIKEFSSCAIIIGNEGSGISRELSEAFPNKVRIRINPEMESLNASISASIALHEISRSNQAQR